MAHGPSEAPLPPAYRAVHAAHQRLAEAERQLRWRQAVDATIAAEEQRLRPLWVQLAQERADVEALESRTVRSMRSKLRRSHEADLTAEQADVRAVEAEIAVRLEAIDAIDESPGPATVDRAVGAVEQARADLDDAMEWWRAEHVAAGSQLGLRLLDLNHQIAYLEALRRELHEALDVARLATVALAAARAALTLTGMLSWAEEKRKIDAIANVQRWLLELRAELADLREVRAPMVDGPDFVLPSLHIGSGDVFDEWIVDNRVIASSISIEATLARVYRVAAGLDECADRLDNQIDALERESWDLLLEHPGVV